MDGDVSDDTTATQRLLYDYEHSGTSKTTLSYRKRLIRLQSAVIFEAVLFELGYSYNNEDAEFRVPRLDMSTDLEENKRLLKRCEKLLVKRNARLNLIGKHVTNFKENEKMPDEELKKELSKVAMTRTELKAMGIEVKSELSCSIADLPAEAQELINKEIATGLQEKVILLMNDSMTKDKREDANLKDGVSALGTVYKMLRLAQEKSTSNSIVHHDLSSLVSQKSKEEMIDIFTEEDFKDVDADIIDVDSEDIE